MSRIDRNSVSLLTDDGRLSPERLDLRQHTGSITPWRFTMPPMRQRWIVVLVCATLVTACAPNRLTGFAPLDPAPDTASTPKIESSVPTVLIIDGSRSMTEADAPGPRIDAAKSAARQLIDALPDDSTISLQTYGTTTGSTEAERAASCRDITTLLPLGALDRAAMADAIDSITPSGFTPMTLSLRTAADQLPADDTPQAIVLVSDGEETCATPPCDVAALLRQTHPQLTISTVGFRVDGPASDQLRCIARATGGVYVQADNAAQLAARLIATQNIDRANTSLSATGRGGIDLGATITDIRSVHSDFPDVSGSGTVVVTWRDCDYTFTNGTLTAIAPRDGGRTIDGVTTGSSIRDATDLYGNPIGSDFNGSTGTVTFTADPRTDAAYRMTVELYADITGRALGEITSIVLCRCKPSATSTATRPPGVDENTVLSMTFPPYTCGDENSGWANSVPITVSNGDGEARTASGEFGGASITEAKLLGWLDADGNGTEEAVVTFTCFGSTFDMCCAGRTSMMKFAAVYDFSEPKRPQPLGGTITPGESPVRGQQYGESRYFDAVRIDGSTIITDEKLNYPDTSGATADLGYSPYATVEVTHRFTDGRWTTTERVIG